MASQRYVALDSWRGIAALTVAVFHLQVASHIYPLAFTRNAYLFVDFFFVLSGFVISHAYAGRIATGDSVRRFLIKRLGRVYPLHVTMLGAFVLAETAVWLASSHLHGALPRPPFSGDRTVPAILVNLALLNGVGIYPGSTWNGPSWSISAEFVAYLAFAAFVFAPKRVQGPLAAVLALGSAAFIIAFSDGTYLGNPSFGVARCIMGFFTGHLIWRGRNAALPGAGTLAEIGIAGLGLAFVAAAKPGPLQMMAPLAFGAIIFVFSKEAGAVSRLLTRPGFQLLGRLSFAIYMVHFFLCFAINNVIRVGGKLLHVQTTAPGTDLALIGNPFVMDLSTGFYLAAVVGAAFVLNRLVETPGMNFANELAKAKPGRSAPAAALEMR